MEFVFALIYNVTAIPIAAGIFYPLIGKVVLSPMLAAIAMVISDITVILNSLSLKRFKR